MKTFPLVWEHFSKIFTTVFLVIVGVLVPAAHATDYYIAPNGSASGTGSIGSPWNITSGLQKSSVVKPGDKVWLRGGTYGSGGPLVYTVTLKGSSSAPVIVRQYGGERAIVNGALKLSSSYLWLWGFEVTNSSTKRQVSNIDTERPRGILIGASTVGVKVINMVVHDVGRAGVAGGGNNFEVYGTLFWGNGIYDLNYGGNTYPRGDAAYLQLWHATPDPNATNYLRDNIGFRNFYGGYKVYSEWSGVYVDGYYLEGNASFDNGARASGNHEGGNFLVDATITSPPVQRLKVLSNYSYRTSDSTNPYNAEFGCKQGSRIQCQSAEIRNNYFVSGASTLGTLRIMNWKDLQVQGNSTIGNGSSTLAEWTRDFVPESAAWNHNNYYGGSAAPLKLTTSPGRRAFAPMLSAKHVDKRAQSYSFPHWKATTADTNSSYSSSRPTGSKIFVRKNLYEPGQRANIIVYNWDLKSSVSVDLSSAGLADGTNYEIIDSQNYFGAPVATGTYHPSSPSINLPMKLSAVTPLVGNVTHLTNKHTAPEFAAFVLRAKLHSAQ